MIKQVCKGAATVAAVVALSACGGADPDGAEPPESKSPSPSPTSVDALLSGTWGSRSGTWSSGPGGVFVLRVEGSKVELMGDRHCRGNVAREDGLHVIRLTCDDGNTDRSVGRVYGLSADGMTVEWEGLGADSFERAE
ncbi:MULTISPECIES: hypothetical protein [unclassified Streptomyces]|uniref:hypothetical protein n=1 Tax=unclassified Streptomyces TaxID=2593676 RepID=UPI0019FCD077|nr:MULTISPECIES: hypothetical protein [unclassified Streptomyces]KAF2777313.1 hypothetical protein STPH1_1974 [Streptomyces sp. OM5714]